jgi:hypothetical protein
MSATIEPEIAVPKGRLLPSAGSSSPKVMRAIMGVMKRVKAVRKEGWNSEGKYGFVMANDARALLQDAMIEEDLHISQREVRWEIVNKVLTVYYEFDARHVESGETIYNIASSTGACRFEFKSGTTDDKSFSKSKTSSEKDPAKVSSRRCTQASFPRRRYLVIKKRLSWRSAEQDPGADPPVVLVRKPQGKAIPRCRAPPETSRTRQKRL